MPFKNDSYLVSKSSSFVTVFTLTVERTAHATCVIDSGASCSIFSSAVVDDLGLDVSKLSCVQGNASAANSGQLDVEGKSDLRLSICGIRFIKLRGYS